MEVMYGSPYRYFTMVYEDVAVIPKKERERERQISDGNKYML